MKLARLPFVLLTACAVSNPIPQSPSTTQTKEENRLAVLRFTNVYFSPVTLSIDDGEPIPVAPFETKTVITTKQKKWLTSNFRFNLRVSGPAFDVTGETTTTTNVEELLDVDSDGSAPVSVVAQASRIDSTPARISTNFTVGKQTVTQSFGARVALGFSGVQVVDGVDIDGDCVADIGGSAGVPARIAINDGDGFLCESAPLVFIRPASVPDDAIPYPAVGNNGLVMAWDSPKSHPQQPTTVDASEGTTISALTTSRLALSRPRASLYLLNVHPTGASVDVRLGDESLGTLAAGELRKVAKKYFIHAVHAGPERLPARTLTVTAGGAPYGGFTFEPDSTVVTGPCRPPYLCDFLLDQDTLILIGDATDSSQRVRPVVVPRPTSESVNVAARVVVPVNAGDPSLEIKSCFAVFAGDDTCVMGAVTAVSSVAHLGGAAAASYAATGRMAPALYPPAQDAPGVMPRFRVRQNVLGAAPTAFAFSWSEGHGLNAPGLAIIAPGTLVNPANTDRRALLFVDTSVEPWTVTAPIVSD